MLTEIAFLRSAVEDLQTATAFVNEDDIDKGEVHHEDTAVCAYSGQDEYQCAPDLEEMTSSNSEKYTKIGSIRVHSSTMSRTEVENLASTLVQTLCQVSFNLSTSIRQTTPYELICDTQGSLVYLDDMNATAGA